jgi:biopolymer transport protein TolR
MATGSSLRKPRRLMNQINVVPYIDVMLVLLVIFMVTAPLINPGQVELPQVGQGLSTVEEPIEISVTAEANLLIRDRAEGETEERGISRAELARIVKAKQAKRPNQPVVIAGDKAVRYEEVLKVMDMLQQARVKRVGLLAQPRSN